MTTIDRTKPVLVTGANGYVASWLVKRLLDEGLTVHAAVRDPKNEKKIAHLKEVAARSKGQIKFFASDLLKPGSYKEAMEGCELVYHTASPFVTNVKDPQKELIDPAVNGTASVLNSANEVSSVKRVVVTSSCAAIYTDAIDTVNAPEHHGIAGVPTVFVFEDPCGKEGVGDPERTGSMGPRDREHVLGTGSCLEPGEHHVGKHQHSQDAGWW
jgi:nucleoside-diphosphate-sugar epimerase